MEQHSSNHTKLQLENIQNEKLFSYYKHSGITQDSIIKALQLTIWGIAEEMFVLFQHERKRMGGYALHRSQCCYQVRAI
jgi:hypothetical protein